ncbi:MAG: YraN family protein [Candidatus Promineifilaceae bacterium]|nr:YraN family protein [Candidatus Promineifilaceae bacterium]
MSERDANTGGARKRLGQWGERVAALHLEAKGYSIMERNWRCERGEIDLVARAGEIVLFVEVRTRRGRHLGTPEESITPRKAKKLLSLAARYIAERNLSDVDWRVDLVAVELDRRGKLVRCEHIPNAIRGW